MDPNACYTEFLGHLERLEWLDAYAYGKDLLEWLARGGFKPDWEAGRELDITTERQFHNAMNAILRKSKLENEQ
jgi:hypothetical protein